VWPYLVVTGSVGSGRVTFADARTGAVLAAEAAHALAPTLDPGDNSPSYRISQTW